MPGIGIDHSKNKKMKSGNIAVCLVIGLVLGAFFNGCAEEEPVQPNIIVIMTDDQGYQDVGFNGCRDIPTPNIDRLAAGGVRFSSGYVSMSYCSPTRAGLVTGRHPVTFGYTMNPNPILAPGQGLPPGTTTIGGYLQEQGYVTCGVGKWHLGSTPDRHPNTMGFTEWYGFLGGGHAYFPLEHPYYGDRWEKLERPWPEHYINQSMPILRNSEIDDHRQYLTRDFTDRGIEFIRGNRDKPFFLYLAYNAPHTPYEAPVDVVAQFPEEKLTSFEKVDPAHRAIYAAMVSEVDRGVGRIMEALKKEGLSENTLVWFLSDNGGCPHPKCPSSNLPLRGYKGTMYEGGIRVPFVLSWPGKVKAGSVLDQPVTALDIVATAFALSGGDLREADLHGKDLTDLVTGKSNQAPHEALFWKHGYYQRGAIRKGNFKLVITNDEVELFNLVDDLSEEHDLSGTQPELASELMAEWNTWDSRNPPALWKPVPREEWTRDENQYASYPYLKGHHHFKAEE